MKIDDVIREVTTIRQSMSEMIADSSTHVLPAVIANLYEQKKAIDARSRKAAKLPWKLVIAPNQPLVFQSTSNETLVKHHLEVDLACTLSEPDTKGIPLGEHNIAVRVWATKPDLCFRDALDAEALRKPLLNQGRRVMLRFHFDLANDDQAGPRHHLQIGGKGAPTDYAWFPENWKLPRFVHLPVNLALVCEFIARTFYPSRFEKIEADPTWSHTVKVAEETYLFPFLSALPYVSVEPTRWKSSLLSSVWNG